MGRVVLSGSLGGVMVFTLAQYARNVGFDSRSRHNIFHFHHPPHYTYNDILPDMGSGASTRTEQILPKSKLRLTSRGLQSPCVYCITILPSVIQ